MKEYLSNLLPRLNQYSQTLDKKELLVDQPWVLLDDDLNKQQYIFERTGNLIMSYNGKVQYGKWRYIPAARSLVIDREKDSLLLNHAFVSPGACIMKKDGFTDIPFVLVNERIVPDLDLEKYLRSLLPENQSLQSLNFGNLTIYYAASLPSPHVGTKVTTLNEGDTINGTFKTKSNICYEIKNNVVVRKYEEVNLKTDKGILTIHIEPFYGINKNDEVTMGDAAARDGDYIVLENGDIKKIVIRNGKVFKISSKGAEVLIIMLVLVGMIIIAILIATLSKLQT